MSLTHVTAIRNGMADYVVDAVDVGSGDAHGDLVLMTAGGVAVATLAFANPAFGAASSGGASSNTITDDSNAVGGTVALFKFQDRDNSEVLRGTVTATGGGGDLEITTTAVTAGDVIHSSGISYSAPT